MGRDGIRRPIASRARGDRCPAATRIVAAGEYSRPVSSSLATAAHRAALRRRWWAHRFRQAPPARTAHRNSTARRRDSGRAARRARPGRRNRAATERSPAACPADRSRDPGPHSGHGRRLRSHRPGATTDEPERIVLRQRRSRRTSIRATGPRPAARASQARLESWIVRIRPRHREGWGSTPAEPTETLATQGNSRPARAGSPASAGSRSSREWVLVARSGRRSARTHCSPCTPA